ILFLSSSLGALRTRSQTGILGAIIHRHVDRPLEHQTMGGVWVTTPRDSFCAFVSQPAGFGSVSVDDHVDSSFKAVPAVADRLRIDWLVDTVHVNGRVPHQTEMPFLGYRLLRCRFRLRWCVRCG